MNHEVHVALPPKVLQLYRAVMDMLSEGQDMHTMKVQDITKRAGIGKGTAYEYFSSKEELISEALKWNFRTQLLELRGKIYDQPTFRKKIFTLLDWMQQNISNRKSFFEMIGNSGHKCCKDEMLYQKKVWEDIDKIIKTGEEEGIISAEISEYNRLTGFASQIVTYFFYLSKGKMTDEGSIEKIKEQVYENIVRLYQ